MLSYFIAERGFGFENENVQMISGTGAPGTGGDSTTVGVGSIYMEAATGDFYKKHTAGAGAGNWDKMATLGDVGSGISWREPSLVRDDTLYANIAAAETAANVGDLVDGVTIAASDRLLFSNLTAGNENIYIVSGSSGAWTFTEDTNLATEGDATYIQQGTSAGFTYVFNGTDWVLISQGALTEIGFIQAYIGKPTDGNVLPQYTSNNHIADNDSLTVALGKVDAVLGAAITVTGNIITIGQSVYDAIRAIDAWSATVHVDSVSLGVTTITVIDSVLVDVAAHVKWTLNIRDGATSIRSRVSEVTHDGVDSGADATQLDFTNFAALNSIGPLPTGLTIAFALIGAGAAQAVELRVTSTTSVDVRAIREIVPF